MSTNNEWLTFTFWWFGSCLTDDCWIHVIDLLFLVLFTGAINSVEIFNFLISAYLLIHCNTLVGMYVYCNYCSSVFHKLTFWLVLLWSNTSTIWLAQRTLWRLSTKLKSLLAVWSLGKWIRNYGNIIKQGSHGSWKVLKFEFGFFRTWKVLKLDRGAEKNREKSWIWLVCLPENPSQWSSNFCGLISLHLWL